MCGRFGASSDTVGGTTITPSMTSSSTTEAGSSASRSLVRRGFGLVRNDRLRLVRRRRLALVRQLRRIFRHGWRHDHGFPARRVLGGSRLFLGRCGLFLGCGRLLLGGSHLLLGRSHLLLGRSRLVLCSSFRCRLLGGGWRHVLLGRLVLRFFASSEQYRRQQSTTQTHVFHDRPPIHRLRANFHP
ncbi:hypothetical protein AUC70_02660 [Methyloceanibacter stevinii]|uniref:Uncharacterized protein n=1 Tax=Methyloceanibacter stevinii TaxID=1774970 RepID=A0A1E3VQJ8_9HYPH|nr:hypothetical protein AUC70_02660 [Methyloceanibacter stevinii]